MKALSWLFGSLSVACLCAGLLLLLQPSPAQAAGFGGNCSDCACMCVIAGTPGNCSSTGCPQCKPGVPGCTCTAITNCKGAFGSGCWCSQSAGSSTCDVCN